MSKVCGFSVSVMLSLFLSQVWSMKPWELGDLPPKSFLLQINGKTNDDLMAAQNWYVWIYIRKYKCNFLEVNPSKNI